MSARRFRIRADTWGCPYKQTNESCIHGSFNVTFCISNPSKIAYFRPRCRWIEKNEAKNNIFHIHSAIAKCLQLKENEKGLFPPAFCCNFAGCLSPVWLLLTPSVLRTHSEHAPYLFRVDLLPVLNLHIMHKQGLNSA